MSKPKFKVGDKVRILDGSKIKGYTGGWFNHMARRIGEIATIKSITKCWGTPGYCYRLEEFSYIWDEFDFNIGAKLAFERLTNPEPEKPKYFSGKIVCITAATPQFTTGKIYDVVNGNFRDDKGFLYPCNHSIEEINSTTTSQFIGLVE